MGIAVTTAIRGAVAAICLAVVVVVASASSAVARPAAVVIDGETGAVLYQSNMHRHYPASLTKMMTLYLLFEALDQGKLTLETKLFASKRAAGQPNSKLGLRQGQSIRVREAIVALVVKSANDVGTVVSEALAGTESKFAGVMTEKAMALGMTKTRFRNATGLPNKGQVSTAGDLARLAFSLYRDFPQYYHYFGETSFEYRRQDLSRPQHFRRRLYWRRRPQDRLYPLLEIQSGGVGRARRSTPFRGGVGRLFAEKP